MLICPMEKTKGGQTESEPKTRSRQRGTNKKSYNNFTESLKRGGLLKRRRKSLSINLVCTPRIQLNKIL